MLRTTDEFWEPPNERQNKNFNFFQEQIKIIF